MSVPNKRNNIFLGIAAALSGVYHCFQKNYFLGICSVIIGVGLSVRNYKEYKGFKQ